MIQIAIFASGSGTNAQNIAQYFDKQEFVSVSGVYYNRKDAGVVQRMKALEIPCIYVKNSDFRSGNILRDLNEKNIDFIVLAGFLVKIPEVLVNAYPDRIINIHPSLLPKYGGKGMYGSYVHQAVKTSGDSITGITIHLVNEEYDKGAILFQAETEVFEKDSPEDIAKKVHELEYAHFPMVLEQYFKNYGKEV